ncbi:glycoside hydrolase family 3 N-terminal domain-containing protein [Oceanobacillus picturae]|uniref:glycoside hydrolase family 3 N-terminal domain-containing protein n=1 Tax=Oceanobacillus picturae TaxID=171693 RepID=UPI00362B33E3
MAIYQSPNYSIEARVDDLISKMTLTEKVGQLNQKLYGWEAYEKKGRDITLTKTFTDEVHRWDGIGVLYGLFRADPWSARTYKNGITAAESPKLANQIQRYILENTRLGIPALLSEECPHGHQALDGTMISTNIGVGSTWNPQLMKDMYQHIANEIRRRGAHLGLISTLDIMRDPRWGRSEECFGEDPFLAASFTRAVVDGLQGGPFEKLASSNRIGAILKHFSAQGAGEGGINAAPAVIGERELRDIHLPAMKAGAEAGAAGCMAAYNEIDGVPCHANKGLLTGILRDEWDFKGIVMADGVAIDRLEMQTGSYVKAAATALDAGVDVSLWDESFTNLEEAVKTGLVTEEDIDRSVRRVLTLKFSLGLFENPYVEEETATTTAGAETVRQANIQVARESVVLLKNEGNQLPLQSKHKRIAVIGPNADSIYNQLGDYTSTQKEGKGTTVLEGIKKIAPNGTEIVYAKGCGIREGSPEEIREATEKAKDADVIVLAVGGSSSRDFDIRFDTNGAAFPGEQPADMDCGEGMDLADLNLGGMQESLIEELGKLGKPMVGIVIQGRPHAIGSLVESSQSVLCAWYPGQEGGTAIAEILFGHVNPSGKLPVSIPRSSGQLPVYYNHKDMGRLLPYRNMEATPLFSFGYGLSYTTFNMSACQLSRDSISLNELNEGATVTLEVTIENTGAVDGAEVVQLYRYDAEASVTSRIRELKGFKKLFLQSKEKQTISFSIGKDELSIWNNKMEYCAEPGLIQWYVGGNSKATIKADLQVTP